MSGDDSAGRASPAGQHAEADGQPIPEQVAEIAGELSEAEDVSRRKRLARQIPRLAGRRGRATTQRLQSGRDAARQRMQSGTGAVAQRVRPAAGAAGRAVRSGSAVTAKRAQAGGSATVRGLRASGRWLADQVIEMAPKVPIRSLGTLQTQYPGLQPEQLADQLITGAARASAGVGVAVGVAAAVPFIPTAPVELGVETLALVAIELKLIAELHEVFGMPAPGSGPQRMLAYTGSWAERRGVRVTSGGLALAMGSPLRRKLERRLLAKAGQSTLALAPLFAGAAAGALIDHHETRRLGTLIRDDLRKRSPEAPAIAG
ncbi:MAG TPA: hypothetical protein VMA32_04700 [Streptosporangiaceae bacterium]|nr:hypothetical protein [Streptosporangiaceae bacterium]